ncbi:30S ribosomal protein S11 [endosymbiont GvMRE of Glomus versiforme]|uniref:small ribosomal subunit protein uS11 n=1 Tax=endosymbiont GvMRE of Glomus versiforme TaxID=2039283 RepID=UPI000ED1F5CC|nr:30S ribosomal protein S11 [endosymbiont GvMRE of Glomus versiforme]RHZ37627.1 30S ribosomal protein S11 [endosymbiont GvMRE of Glomus versiforme]
MSKDNLEKNKKIKKVKKISSGRGKLHIHSSFNNLIITITQENGDKLPDAQISSRTATGYRGAKASTFVAAEKAAKVTLEKLTEFGISLVEIIVWGIGSGQDAALKKFRNAPGLQVKRWVNKTPLAFNGCRPRKTPRK